MGSFSWVHWLLVIVVFLLLFGGRGKISELMGDFASGIKAFKKGMSEEETAKAEPAKSETKTIDHQPAGSGAPADASVKNRAETEKRFEGGTV
jgi:sec-independent protein translocase protein TatA